MLTYVALCVTAYLILKIVQAPRGADASGYLLVSGLIPLPLYIMGNSAQASISAIDVCLLVFLLAHGKSALQYALEHRRLSAGVGALFGLSILATCSGAFNLMFVDSDPAKFYAFTVVKFWQYALLAALIVACKPDRAQLRRTCSVLVAGILVYEILHALHISGILPLSGEQYFGPRAAEVSEWSAAPFSDRTGWFLTSYRVVVGGTASISAWFSMMVFETYRGRLRLAAGLAAVLSVFSVVATSSRSDMAGLAVAAIVFALCAPLHQWKVYARLSIAAAALYAGYVAVSLGPAGQAEAMDRISELWNPALRADGSYADRSHDRSALIAYLPDHPRELLIGAGPGNFHRYASQGITINFYGHNAYLHWTGELGIGGLVLLLTWCLSVDWYAAKRLRCPNRICELAARTCLALVVGRMVASWGAESLFGTQGMGYYSLYFVGVVYLLVSLMSDVGNGRVAVNAG